MSRSATEPILVELGEARWKAFIDSVATWLGTVHMAQSDFRQLAVDTADSIEDPRMKEAIERIAAVAIQHEQQLNDLYGLVGREPQSLGSPLGGVLAKSREALGHLLGRSGGASGAWNDLRQLLLANLNAIGAFGAVEQLGLTLGLPDLAKQAFTIVREKSTDQLIIEEFMLELAPQAILYEDSGLGQPTGHRSEPAPPDQLPGMQPAFPKGGKPDAPIVGNQVERDRD